jgi:hypothetical protein
MSEQVMSEEEILARISFGTLGNVTGGANGQSYTDNSSNAIGQNTQERREFWGHQVTPNGSNPYVPFGTNGGGAPIEMPIDRDVAF